MALFDYIIMEIESMLERKDVCVSVHIDESFQGIKEVDDKVQAFLTLNEQEARTQAKELDDTGYTGKEKLFGIPVGIKDNIAIKGMPLTCGSQFLRNFDDPLYNATVIEK